MTFPGIREDLDSQVREKPDLLPFMTARRRMDMALLKRGKVTETVAGAE